MSLLYLIVGLVAAQRLIELEISRRNTKWLLARGAHEVGRRHYPLFVALHSTWLLAVLVLVDTDASINPWWLSLFLILQGARVWVMVSLGRYWTTRIITLPDAPLIDRGPFRYCRHPNYMIVVGEFAALPLAFGAWSLALAFSLLNGALLFHRVKVENSALQIRRNMEIETLPESGELKEFALPSKELGEH